MNFGEIKKNDIANGEGVRVSLFVSGCRIHCSGCFNTETWNFYYGQKFTKEIENEIIKALRPEFISGLSVLGGEPFEEENQQVLSNFLQQVKDEFPKKTIWCYTGYYFDRDILPKDGAKHCESTDKMLSYIDVVVDGPFIQEQKDLMLCFRGSQNQRIWRRNVNGIFEISDFL